MKNTNENCCPGCRRHCSRDKLCCKHGRAYFAEQKRSDKNMMQKQEHKSGHLHKWERYVQPDGLAWNLLYACRSTKRALRDRKITEEELFARLSDLEKENLREILEKLSFSMV